MVELSKSKMNKIRNLAIQDVRPEGWVPRIGESVFIPHRMPESVENRDPVTGLVYYEIRDVITLRSGVYVASVASKTIDPDIVVVKEPSPGCRKRRVLTRNLRPFRGWEAEQERLPPPKKNSRVSD